MVLLAFLKFKLESMIGTDNNIYNVLKDLNTPVCNKSIVSSVAILSQCDSSMTLSSLVTVKNLLLLSKCNSSLLVKKVISFQMCHK